MSNESINNILDHIQNSLDNMVKEHYKSEELFNKQIKFMKQQHEYSIDKIDRLINLYKTKYPKIRT